jgi:hypothetical protein
MHEEPAYSMYIEIVYNLGSIKKEFKHVLLRKVQALFLQKLYLFTAEDVCQCISSASLPALLLF